MAAFCSTSRIDTPLLWMSRSARGKLLDHDGREPDGGLVDQQQFRARHQAAREGEDLLLATGQAAGPLLLARLQDREAGVIRLDVGIHRAGVAAQESAELQIFAHAHAREQALAFRHMHQPELQPAARGKQVDPLAGEPDLAGGRRLQAGYRPQAGCLAGPVGADQGHRLALVDMQRHVVEHAGRAIGHGKIAQLKQHRRRRSPDRRR